MSIVLNIISYHDPCEVQLSKLPYQAIKGDSLCIKITQEEYDQKSLADCKKNLYGRLLFKLSAW
jgi:hypothetical protein